MTTKANAYKCYKLLSHGTSDHDAVIMIPKYTPACKSQPTYITEQLWSSDNIEKLIDCLKDTDWPTILSDLTINNLASIFTDCLNFCIEQCIPSVRVRNRCDKPWMNDYICRLIAQRCLALNVDEKALVRHIKSVTQREKRFAKYCYAKSFEKSFHDKPAEASKSLKSVLMLNSNDAGCQFDANEPNQFYNRFDKPSDCCNVVLTDICDISDFFSIDDVYFVL